MNSKSWTKSLMAQILFDNCLILAPDDTILARCGKWRYNKYLELGMAEVVDDDPPTIRLLFEPSGRIGVNDPFVIAAKPNMCCVCGVMEKLGRHHIVPQCFTKYMSLEARTDSGVRDMFAMCDPCHRHYEKIAHVRKCQIVEEHGLFIHGIPEDDYKRCTRAMTAAGAIILHASKIPDERFLNLLEIVEEFVGKKNLTIEEIEEARWYDIRKRPDYQNPWRAIAENTTYDELAKGWRQHFVDTMNPQHLPDCWSVDRKIDLDKVWVSERSRKGHKNGKKLYTRADRKRAKHEASKNNRLSEKQERILEEGRSKIRRTTRSQKERTGRVEGQASTPRHPG